MKFNSIISLVIFKKYFKDKFKVFKIKYFDGLTNISLGNSKKKIIYLSNDVEINCIQWIDYKK